MAVGSTHAASVADPFGVYIHIPFCKQICSYCDFNVRKLPPEAPWDALGRALDAELQTRSAAFGGKVASVYFGGGTPSLASAAFIAARLSALRRLYRLTNDCEITLEADPNTIDCAQLAAMRAVGITRLSLGWQSTHQSLLALLGRQHTPAQAQALVHDARAAGFDNINVDLIYAVPTQTLAQLEADLDALAAVSPEHVSLYSLTYAPGTPLSRKVARGELARLSEQTEAQMGALVAERLDALGLARYEVSNFAKASRQSRHNLGYWRGAPYLGIGPGAHSFVPRASARAYRWESVRGVGAYLAAWQQDASGRGWAARTTPPQKGCATVSFVEALGDKERAYEQLLVGLRQPRGLDIALLQTTLPALERHARTLVQNGLAKLLGSWLVPTARGLDCADAAATLCASD